MNWWKLLIYLAALSGLYLLLRWVGKQLKVVAKDVLEFLGFHGGGEGW